MDLSACVSEEHGHEDGWVAYAENREGKLSYKKRGEKKRSFSSAHEGKENKVQGGRREGGESEWRRITGIVMIKSPCRIRASAHFLCVLVCFAPALLSAQRPLPPGLPCGWEAVWNDSQSVYSYRNVFTDEQTSREPPPLSSSSNACPSASPLGAYGM